MKLTAIAARNLKGFSFELPLGPMTFLVGNNFVGKSARTDAIRLLLLGHLPELGKLARATFGLCSGRELLVAGTFDDGTKITRRWFLMGDAIKTEVAIVGGTPALHSAIETGEILAVMLDAETYFGLSDRARVDYVFANLPGLGGAFDPAAVVATLARGVAGVEGIDAKVLDEFVKELTLRMRDAEREVDDWRWTPQTVVDFALEFARAEEATTKAKAAIMEKTAQGLAYIRTQEVPEVDLPAVEAAILATGKEINELRDEKARRLAAFEQARANKRRRTLLESEIAGSAVAEQQRTRVASEVASRVAELEKLAPAPDDREMEELRLADREAAVALPARERDLRAVLDSITANERERAQLGSATKCAYCGATGDAWKVLKSAEIESALAGLRTKKDQLGELVATIREASIAADRRFRIAVEARGLRGRKERDLREAQAALAEIERRTAAATAKREELARIPAEDPALATALATAEASIAEKLTALAALETRRRSSLGRANDLKRVAEAEKNRDEAKADNLVAKSAAAALRAMQEKMVEDAFGPLLDAANAFFIDVLKTPLAYNAGEIGTWREGTWVGHRTFSGTEKALAYAAIQSALASRSPVRIAIVDELGRLDDDNAMRFAVSVAGRIEAGAIDQFVGIDTGRAMLYSSAAIAGSGIPIAVAPIVDGDDHPVIRR